MKLLEENLGRTLHDINHSKILYDPLPRVMEIKTKINNWDLIKLKNPKQGSPSIATIQVSEFVHDLKYICHF